MSLFAQEPVSIHLTEKDGLPDIEFYDIIEDKQGFIWLAADKGLYRYDGKTFKNYSHPKKKGLSVFGLKFDYKNRLWCNNISGQLFYVENDSLKYFTEYKKKNRGQLADFIFYKKKIITSITNSTIEIDIVTKEQKTIFSKSKHQHSSFVHKDTLYNSRDNLVSYKVNDTIKVKDSVKFIDIKGTLIFKGENLGENNDAILQIINLHKNEKAFFLKTANKITQLTRKDFNLNTEIIRTYTENYKVWFATHKGVYKYKYDQGKFTFIERLFKNNVITNIIKDKNNNYWFTTLRDGIYILPNINVNFYKATANDNISALEKINDNEFIYGTTKGEVFLKNIKSKKRIKLPFSFKNKIFKIRYNKFNNIIISTKKNAYLFNLEKKAINNIHPYIIRGLGLANAKGMSFIDENNLVFGGFINGQVINFKNKSSITLGNRRTYTTHFNKLTKRIYIGYVDGVEYYKQDLKPNKITFNNKTIFAIDIDNTPDNIVWLSTFSDGILGVKNGKVIYNYTTKNGLLSNQTSVIKADGNNLWIVTDKGIQCFNTKNKTFKSVTKKDGLRTFKVSDIAVFDTKVVFSTNKGLFELNKAHVFKPIKLSDFYFTNILVEDENVAIKDEYDLASNINKVQFQFHTNGILAEENINYKYRLLGASNQWRNLPEKSNQITFNSLSAGNYTFQLKKTSTISSNKETPIKSVKIKINQPFYKKWWFLSSLLGIVSMLLIIYYKIKLREKEKEKKLLLDQAEKEKELVFLKLENLRSQMNPHFIFNALNSIQDYILLNEKNIAGNYLGKFADLIRVYLYHSTKSFITLEEEITALDQYLELEKSRFEEAFNYVIKTTGVADTNDIEIPTMLVQPYVENAIKHGFLHKKEPGVLTIEFILEKETPFLKCIISDNGIGRVKAQEFRKRKNPNHKSFATKANQDRLSLLNFQRKEKIGVEIIDLYTNNLAKGTQVHIKIPYKNI